MPQTEVAVVLGERGGDSTRGIAEEKEGGEVERPEDWETGVLQLINEVAQDRENKVIVDREMCLDIRIHL